MVLAGRVLLIAPFLVAAAAPTLDFSFLDPGGRPYRSTRLAESIAANTGLRASAPRLLVVHAPSPSDSRLKAQVEALAGLDFESLQMLFVVSLSVGSRRQGYHTDAANSAKVGGLLAPFGVAILDASGVVLLQAAHPVSAPEVVSAVRSP